MIAPDRPSPPDLAGICAKRRAGFAAVAARAGESILMLALTLWQPWASLIIAGAKPYEFRSWPLTQGRGVRWAVHAAARPARRSEIAEILGRLERGDNDGMSFSKARALLVPAMGDPSILPLGAVVGSVMGGTPVKASALFVDAAPDVWANPVFHPDVFARPIPAKGRQGWWRFDFPEGTTT